LLPVLKSNLPAAVQVDVLTDRTTTIRASVQDVEFELMLTVALSSWSFFCSCAMFPPPSSPASPSSLHRRHVRRDVSRGFSLNNLTLMALTISTGSSSMTPS